MNDEFLNPNDERMTKAEVRSQRVGSFELRHSFVIRAYSFVIPRGHLP
jgi:hypothetical protein